MPNVSAVIRTLGLLFALAAGFAAVSFVPPSLGAVFGPDDRAPLSSARHAMAAKIGLLKSAATGAVCTAFCLSRDVIATAGHCVFGTSLSKPPSLSSLEFALPGLVATGVAGGAIGNHAQNIIAGAGHLRLAPPIGAASDWAAVKLAKPVCAAGGLTLSTTPPDKTDSAYHVAFHRDIAASGLQVAAGCALGASATGASPEILARDFADWRSILLHTCDTGGGSSGSPMLIDLNGAPSVVGVNVGTYVAAHGVPSASIAIPPSREPIANTAIAVAPLAEAFAVLNARNLLDRPGEVKRVQQRLKRLKLYDGAETGRVDAVLIAAVRAYEAQRLQPDTGLLNRALLEDLAAGASFFRKRMTGGAQPATCDVEVVQFAMDHAQTRDDGGPPTPPDVV